MSAYDVVLSRGLFDIVEHESGVVIEELLSYREAIELAEHLETELEADRARSCNEMAGWT